MNLHNQNKSEYFLPDPKVNNQNGVLRSLEFDDIFFSDFNGLDESRYVFCQGTDLHKSFKEKSIITIAELGFGTGLNLIAAIDLHNKLNSNCKVCYISFEACPLFPEHMEIAHKPFEEIKIISKELIKNLPKRWPGVHKFTMNNDSFHIYLYYGDAYQYLSKLNFHSDVWFLDGFSPKKNSELWTEAILNEVVRCSSSEANIATFSVASQVKKNLQSLGCIINKRPGFAKKREVLSATAPVKPKINVCYPKKVIIIGAGIAGASVAYSLQTRGIDHVLIEQASISASKASGNPIGMQYAKIKSWDSLQTRFYVSALSYAASLSKKFDSVAQQGSVIIPFNEKEKIKQEKIFSQCWPSDLACKIEKNQIKNFLGIDLNMDALYQASSNVIFPAKLVRELSQKSQIIYNASVVSIENLQNQVKVVLENGTFIEADLLVLTVGAQLPYFLRLLNIQDSRIEVSKGQLSYAKCSQKQACIQFPVHYGGYIAPCINNYTYFGATFEKQDIHNLHISDEAHRHNISIIPNIIEEALKLDTSTLQGRVSNRLSSLDRLPCVGQISPNIYTICALGSQGMTTAPILAEVLASMISPYPKLLDEDLMNLIKIEKIFTIKKSNPRS